MDEIILNQMSKALTKAKEELDKASYLTECGSNPGLRQMNFNKTEWLRWVVYLAQYGLNALKEEERLNTEQGLVEDETDELICDQCPVSAEAIKIIEQKDKTIKEIYDKLSEATERLESLQASYDCELEYRKALAQQAKIDYFTEVLKLVHERCWFDGTILVTPVEYLDRSLLEHIRIKE